MSRAQLFLLDAHALCYRSFFAIKDLATSKGQATNAVYGFTATLRKILKAYQPDYLAVCFDTPGKTHRHEKFAQYKIQRPVMPDNLISQIPLIRRVVCAYRLAICEAEGFEADDVMATLTRKFANDNLEVIIVSDDKDMFQLVDKNVKVLSPRQEKIFDREESKRVLGIEPKGIVDFISLAGDKSDNIPGIKGIGGVTAKKLISEYGTLENILASVKKIEPPKLREKIMEHKKSALLSKELASLETTANSLLPLEDLKVLDPDSKELFKLFSDLEFKKFAQEFAEDMAASKSFNIQDITSEKQLSALKGLIAADGMFAFGWDSPAEEESFLEKHLLIALRHEKIFRLKMEHVAEIKTIFADEGIVKITHDIKNELKVLRTLGCHVKGKVFDVMLAGYLLAPSRADYTIQTLAWEYLKETLSEQHQAAQSALVVLRLYAALHEDLKSRDILKLFEDIEIPLAYVLSLMETEGVRIDEDLLGELSRQCDKQIMALSKKLFSLAGEDFNLNSPKQLSRILFEKLKLPVIKKTKTGFSTDEGVLRRLAQTHELPALILEYRQIAKLKSTYIDAIPKLINPKTKKVHANFNQTGTETGRLSSSNPNLQNIPVRTELGRMIRKAFIPSKKGNHLIAADYSQIELRILAHLSKDKSLLNAFKDNQDIHDFTAAQIFDVEESDVTPEMRVSAKRVNFGIIYGMSAFGLAKDLDISQNEAQIFIDKYFLRYPGVKDFMNESIARCQKDGYVTTLLNRRRYIPEINSKNVSMRQFAERQAINTPVQGSAADLMKLAMIHIHQQLEKDRMRSRMTITVHDEFVFDVPEEESNAVIKLARMKMENALSLLVPIRVAIKRGANWLDMEEVA